MSDVVRERIVDVHGRPGRVFLGGNDGEHILLVHGVWAGARTHWAPVWGDLSKHFRVIAPDLPSFGHRDELALASVSAYGRWLVGLLDALDVRSARFVGNSLGASIVCRLALDAPQQCAGLVLVNGLPLPTIPSAVRWLGETWLGRRLMWTVAKRMAYTPSAVGRGFFDASRIPEEIQAIVRERRPPQVRAFADVLLAGGGSGSTVPEAYPVVPRLLFGEEDRLAGTNRAGAKKFHASWPGSTLEFVKDAGHTPQIEKPAAFVEALTRLIGERQSQGHAGGVSSHAGSR